MARYIDADKLLKEIKEEYGHLSMFDNEELFAVKMRLRTMPTADVVEVVRCKDCKHRIELYRGAYGCSLQPTPKYVQLCHFCGYGERRDT